jgi:hypothetical protein
MRHPAAVHRVTVRFTCPDGVDQLRVYRVGGYNVGTVLLRTHLLLDRIGLGPKLTPNIDGPDHYIIEAIDGRRLADKQATLNPDTDPWWFAPTHPPSR